MLFYSLFSKTGANLLLFSDICKRVSVFVQKSTRSSQTFGILIFYYSIFWSFLLIESIYTLVYIVQSVKMRFRRYYLMVILWLCYGYPMVLAANYPIEG
jgi:hypothetical protein